MAEMHVAIDGTVPVTGTVTTTPANTSTTPLYVTQVTTPGALIYTTLIEDTAVVTTANNYLSVFNPVGSGKSVVFAQFTAFPYATGATGPTMNMEVWRATVITGGTQLAAANINKFDTAQANSIAEVRTGNPSATLTGTLPILAIPPAITAAAVGVSAAASIIPPTGSLFLCRPGEGVVVRMAAGGDVDERWSLGFTWAEM